MKVRRCCFNMVLVVMGKDKLNMIRLHSNSLPPPAGSVIAEYIVNSSYFKSSKRLGVYLHCAALREVDTTLLVDAALHRSAL